jgi:thiol:disulfide interchange protein DsbC
MRLILIMVMLLSSSCSSASDSSKENAPVVASQAQDVGKAGEVVTPDLELLIRKQIPEMKIRAVHYSPVPGLYEVQSDNNIFYVDRTGRYLIANGHIFDTTTKQDLTAARIEQVRRIDWGVLPLDKAVVSGDPNGIEMAVFTDPDCPYCRTLEKSLKDLKGVKVYTFLMPLKRLHSDATRKSEAIWCSKDQHAALTQVMLEDKAITGGGCDTPLDDIAKLAASLNIHGTPTIIAHDGRTRSGSMPAEQLKAWLTRK